MSREYSENVLVQNSAGNLLQNVLGWEVVLAYNSEKLGPDGTLGRTSYGEVLLTRYFRQALLRLNPWLTPNQLDEVQKKFTAHVSTASLMQINEEKYFLLRDGIPVTVKRPDGRTETRSAAVIDFKNPENNHFLAVKEMKIHSQLYRRRTDIVGFVNGIPLLFIELKKPTVDVQNAYIDNYRDYLDTIPQLFYYNAFLMLSNGLEAKVGTLGSKYEFFHEWKRLKESDVGRVELETMLRGICEKKTFLDLLENFILYDHSGGRTTKILARNHQYLGVNEAVSAYENRKCHTGGSRMTKGRKTTYEERIAFVKECIENGYNYTEISEKYKVGYQQIYTWVQKYKKDGEDALKDRRGRHKKDYKPQTEEERLRLENATLKRQLYLSQMEIDVLKKLQELERGKR